jgi:hypothetical protein
LATDATGGERSRKIYRHTFILASVFLDSFVFDAPLKKLETVAAKLAPERIDIEQAYQALAEADPADAPNVFSGTSGTKRSRHRTFSLWVTYTPSIEH